MKEDLYRLGIRQCRRIEMNGGEASGIKGQKRQGLSSSRTLAIVFSLEKSFDKAWKQNIPKNYTIRGSEITCPNSSPDFSRTELLEFESAITIGPKRAGKWSAAIISIERHAFYYRNQRMIERIETYIGKCLYVLLCGVLLG